MTTNVPQPFFGPTGFIIPTEQQILTGVLADIVAAFASAGYNLNPALNTPQGQLASSMAAIIGQSDDTFLYYTTQTDPAFAQGRMLDAIARIYFLNRNPAEPTTLQVSCSGAVGLNIPLGTLIQDNAGNTYAATSTGTIGIGGTVVLSFANLVNGPIAVPTGSLSIYQAITGFDSVSLVSGVIGVATETDQAFETRRAASVAVNSVGSLSSIKGAVLAVPGVLDAYVTENATSGTATVGGVVLLPNSLYVAVSGGSASSVAQAIWSKKPPGCAMNGNTTVVVQDTNSGYSPPFPSYNITFEIPPTLQIFYSVTIRNSAQVPSNALSQIQGALLNAFAGGTFGGTPIPKAGIGSVLFATSYVPAITALGAWAQVVSLQIGSANTPSAVFTGSATGTSLHVTALTSGTISSGTLGSGLWLVSGTALSGTAAFLPGTFIQAFVSGTVGGTGFYTISQPNTVPSQLISGVLANQNLVSVNINQEPTLITGDISFTLQ